MSFDDIKEIWTSQDERPAYTINEYLLHRAMEQRRQELDRRVFWREVVPFYGSTLVMLLLSALLLWGMFIDDDPRTNADFVVLFAAAGAFLVSTVAIHLDHRKRKRLARRFAASLREEIERDLALIDYEIADRRHMKRQLRLVLPLTVGAALFCYAVVRFNNQPLEWWHALVALFLISAPLESFWRDRRRVRRELYPRKQELQFLREKLTAPEG